ncbi:hypothetical protein AI29_15930 [bacteria symbiont BFo2 of Frankliniella occidentalis]|nr:hypothetical protein AI29_15930 [bacteria symbiont BFo2 of Frankliniella occidentalis]KYP87406.1 hypothetical protein WB60_11575 [bacteria symbiont BFo2 of Frankliniella occidentalis]KYP96069.1 hypothetical protein WB67_04465 [bacteria symbiont BFo2 of Frankliniella occidentalis]
MNRYFQEVIDAHHLISDVLGKQDASGDKRSQLLSRFDHGFIMIAPTGAIFDHQQLVDFFEQQQGSRPGLKITLFDFILIAEDEKNAIIAYKERQDFPDKPSTLRYSTLVFSHEQGRLQWRHLHETFLPL